MSLNKAHFVIAYFFSCLGLLGVLLWVIGYAYSPKHPAWAYWVVPLQQFAFIVCLAVNIVVVVILIMPNDWFIDWAENRLKEIKSKK